MGLIAAVVGSDTAQLSASAGHRIVAVFWSRGGSQSASVAPDAGGATWQQVVAESTLPGNDTARRSLAVFTLDPVSSVDAVTFTADWDGDGTQGLWMVVEEGAGWDLVGTAVADSDTSTVNQLGTGSVASVPAGDWLAVAALASRDGDSGNVVWATTDVQPDLVGGGSVLLDHFGGVGTGGGNAGAAGYLVLAGQPGGSLADQVTLPGGLTRMVTVALAVWAQPSGAEAHEGDGLACTVELEPGVGGGSPHPAGTGQAASVDLVPAAGSGSAAVTAAGQPVGVVLTPELGSGQPAIAGAGQPVQVVLVPDLGAGAASGSGAGPGQPATVILAPGAGLGAPALAGSGLACTLILTPHPGTDVELVTPAERTLTVVAEGRTTAVAAEQRLLAVAADPRTAALAADPRTLTIPEEVRRAHVQAGP